MTSLRRSAWLIVAAALLPFLLFLIFQVGYSAREQRRSIESRALARSEAVILGADAKVERVSAGVDALATARSLGSGDRAEFRSRAVELAGLSGGWRGVQLVDPTTGQILESVGTRPTRLERRSGIVDDRRGDFAGFAWGRGCPCLVFERTTSPSAGRPLLLRVLVSATPFMALLPSINSEYPVSAIATSDALFIARTVKMEERFGTSGSNYLVAAVNSGKRQGIYRGHTLEGLENYTAYARSDLTGWTAHVALGSDYIDNPARRYLASLGFAILVSLVLAGLLIAFAIRQLSEARLLAERMQQAQKLEALGQLTGGIAHDFNNLLTPIVGSLDMISKRSDLDARARRMVDGGLASAKRAAKLTSQLLAFSRRQKLALQPVDLCAMLGELEPMLAQSAGKELVLDIDAGGGACWVETDPTQLELAVINLILNARDVSPPNGHIRIELECVAAGGKSTCRLTVADDGPGMPEDVRRRAFEPFFTTKPQGKGTGLGLAQVYALAQQSHGSVAIDSAPGAGTRVSLTLPAIEAPAAAMELSDAVERDGRALRVLVVEDEADVRATIVAALDEDGHAVAEAESGETALARMQTERFDLLVADFAMPGMNGAQLIAAARERDPAMQFLIVTGYLDSGAVEAAAPGTSVIAKPFDSAALRRRVRDIGGN